jgi:pyrimidine deaminase RibD-like protein
VNDKDIFEKLFEVAKKSKDPEGVVAACLVKEGNMLVSSPSASDGVRHAEDLVLEIAQRKRIKIDDKVTLYTTLEPCSYRSPKNKVKDCTTIIISAGIKNVIFAANDPEYSQDAKHRFQKAGVKYKQIKDKELIRKSVELFNSTITIPLTSMGLPRAKKLPIE